MLTPALFGFLRDLAANNRRDWFQENKARYEAEVRQPILEFIQAFADPLEEISPHFLADKGSMFRIYRDTRFGADKTPYKTHASAQFRHERSKDAHAPCFYLHLQPGEVFAAAGMWRPDGPALTKVRNAIQAWPQRWRDASSGPALGGDSLTRPPRGIAHDHPLIADLKRKDYICSVPFSEAQACRPDFLERFTQGCSQMAPLNRFLCQALDLPV